MASTVNSKSDKIIVQFPSSVIQTQKSKFLNKYLNKKSSESSKSQISITNFHLYQCIGRGAFGQVFLCSASMSESKDSEDIDKFMALKVQSKDKLFKENQIEHVKSEKKVLESVESDFIVELVHSFQDCKNIYLALEYMPGGELFRFLRTRLYFREETAKFYTMQVVLAIEYLHNLDIVYRDIKPENILMDHRGYLKITDFGFAKVLMINENSRTYTLCGTPEYLAPEVILHRGYGQAVDWWSIGILIFELQAGHTPFCSSVPKHIYEKIIVNKYKFPPHFSSDTKSLIKKLLEADVSKRWGNLRHRANDVKNHRWFRNSTNLTWETIYEQKEPLPVEVSSVVIKKKPELQEEITLNIEEEMVESERSIEAFRDF